MDVEQIVKLKAAGMTVSEIKEISEAGLLSSKTAKKKQQCVNVQPLTDVTLENGVVVKAPVLHMKRDGDFITFSAKGYSSRTVSIDDLQAGLEDLDANRIVDVSKAGVRMVARKSSALVGKERKLGENLILAAKNAGFLG